ncbi:hypothetical protein D5F01_LYC03315 [Larimichthys crocea]|uniref:Coiled-coil domain-containing glutamate-rich protein 1 n=1 Tax=Larimichthys crocea TaxID=215358 RepID=A0A6G0J527_LARCR|nr:hypothetical protein D5F01_LYC03315 [Larimichthys crocea]
MATIDDVQEELPAAAAAAAAAAGWKRGSTEGPLQPQKARLVQELQGAPAGTEDRRGRVAKRAKSHHQHHQHAQRHHPHYHHPLHLQRPAMSLRPVNVKGNRARGMRAPKNTNQFLMHEKYQMLHMRSDSVGSDSGSSSDSDMELTDMDSYLGVLENARGALLDSPNPHGSTTPPGQILVLHEDSLRLQEDSLRLQEDSMQYFPSEDDLIQSQNFMQRDFVEFCDILTS